MASSNQNFKPEITQLSNLVIRTRYFSRSANANFTFLSLDKEKKEIKIGIDGKQKTLDFSDFTKRYMKNGVVED